MGEFLRKLKITCKKCDKPISLGIDIEDVEYLSIQDMTVTCSNCGYENHVKKYEDSVGEKKK